MAVLHDRVTPGIDVQSRTLENDDVSVEPVG